MAQNNTSWTRHLPTAGRILLGLSFFIFGLNGFLNFMPAPKEMPAGVMAFMGAMMKTGYFMQMVSITQLVSGAMLLCNRFVPLSLAFLAPVIVNIILFHAFLQPATIAPGVVVTALEIWLAWVYRDAFRPMLAAKVTPSES